MPGRICTCRRGCATHERAHPWYSRSSFDFVHIVKTGFRSLPHPPLADINSSYSSCNLVLLPPSRMFQRPFFFHLWMLPHRALYCVHMSFRLVTYRLPKRSVILVRTHVFPQHLLHHLHRQTSLLAAYFTMVTFLTSRRRLRSTMPTIRQLREYDRQQRKHPT